MRALVLLVVISCAAFAACSSSSSSKAVPAPTGLPRFYAVPAGVTAKSPGTLLKSEDVSTPEVHGSVHRVMYVSTDARGRSVPVTGLVFVPIAPPPPGGYPVVSWSHATNGMADKCTPSLRPDTALGSPALVNAMLGLGWEVVATDYQGEGTPPQLLPFLVGDVAAHNAVDIVAAARKLPSSAAARNYIVFGHSEGGQSALFAWRDANTYGAQAGLRMVGAVAVAPPSQLSTIWQSLDSTPNRVYLFMMLAGFNAAYGKGAAPLGAVLAPKGTALLATLGHECLAATTAAVDASPFAAVVKSNPFQVPAWHRLFAQNDPATFASTTKVPLLIVHGGSDELIPTGTSATLAESLCSKGADLQRWVYPGQNHGGVVVAAATDIGRWMLGRFQMPGRPQGSSDKPASGTGTQAQTCPGGSRP